MNKKILQKANGDVFFEATRQAGNAYLYVNWIGIQTIETMMMGANQLLAMLRRQPCPDILNSHQELIGPWDDGALFLGSQWAPQAQVLGVLHFAQVLAPGIYGQRSFRHFYQLAQHKFQIETFATPEAAQAWLLS